MANEVGGAQTLSRWVGLVACTLALLAPGAGDALAESGQVTRAFASLDWTRGSVAASVTWGSCGPGCPYWAAVATVQPAQPAYDCAATDWSRRDASIRTIWSSGPNPNGTTTSFDFADVGILPGVVGQRVCLMVVQPMPDAGYAESALVARADLSLPEALGAATRPEVRPTAPSTACRHARRAVKRLRLRWNRMRKAGNPVRARHLRRTLLQARSRRAARC